MLHVADAQEGCIPVGLVRCVGCVVQDISRQEAFSAERLLRVTILSLVGSGRKMASAGPASLGRRRNEAAMSRPRRGREEVGPGRGPVWARDAGSHPTGAGRIPQEVRTLFFPVAWRMSLAFRTPHGRSSFVQCQPRRRRRPLGGDRRGSWARATTPRGIQWALRRQCAAVSYSVPSNSTHMELLPCWNRSSGFPPTLPHGGLTAGFPSAIQPPKCPVTDETQPP